MNCKICFSNFNLHDQKKLPRVLIKCGHTFCHQCINKNLTSSNQFVCQQCGKISELIQSDSFPLNETLIGILKENNKEKTNEIKQNEFCQLHGRKLQAYCESDGVILCLQCLLGEHKSHKVVSIDEKVHKEKQILKTCFEAIVKSQQSLHNSSEQCVSLIDKLRLDMDEYIFQINLTCKNIINQLKEIQQNFINQAKKTIQKSIQVAYSTQNTLKDKQNFYKQLKNIYHQLNFKQGVHFLFQLNTSLFITQNSTLKQKYSLPYQKITLKKEKLLNQFLTSIQQLLNFQKKKNSITNPNKIMANDLNNSSIQRNLKNDSKVKSKSKNQSFNKSIEESPLRQPKKSLASIQKISREPQILEVNLVEKYERHQQAKNMKKKSSEIQGTNKCKSTKIEYEVKRQVTIGKDKIKVEGNKIDSFRDELKNNIPINKQQILLDLESSGRLSKIYKNQERNLTNNKFSSSQIGDFTTSFLNQTYFIGSPDGKKQEPFQIQTPFSIKSFMESSQFTINQEKKDDTVLKDSDTVLKDSRSSFTMFNFDQKIYHFGGLRNNSITCLKINPGQASQMKIQSQIIGEGLSRSKSQCVILKSYNSKKCLILGGKDQNGQRTKCIVQFDLTSKKLSKSHLQLIQPISGFGAVVKQDKLYVFGGSSYTALKTLQEYRVQKNGLEMKKLSPMINSRDQLGFAMGFDGYLYVAGGINSSNIILNSCERYCFKTNKWTSISAMKTPRRSFVMVSLPNGLYAIGGHDGKQFLKSVQMYDFDMQKWVDISPMNQARFTHTAVSTTDYQHIIVFGGYQTAPLKSIQIYNVIQQKWTKIQGINDERYLHCSILVQD